MPLLGRCGLSDCDAKTDPFKKKARSSTVLSNCFWRLIWVASGWLQNIAGQP